MANSQPLGSQWRGRAWDDGEPIPRVVLPNGKYAEAVVALPASSTGAVTRVATSTTNATLLAASTTRLGAIVFNDAASSLYVKFGTTASSTDFTVKIDPGGYYEVPYGYSGRIDATLASSTGNAQVTELT